MCYKNKHLTASHRLHRIEPPTLDPVHQVEIDSVAYSKATTSGGYLHRGSTFYRRITFYWSICQPLSINLPTERVVSITLSGLPTKLPELRVLHLLHPTSCYPLKIFAYIVRRTCSCNEWNYNAADMYRAREVSRFHFRNSC